jgi:hypothetical protein
MVEAFAAQGANIYAHARQQTPEFEQDLQRLRRAFRLKSGRSVSI